MKIESIRNQPSATRFPLTDEYAERVVMLAKEQRAEYILKLFVAARSRLVEFSASLRAIAPTSMIRGQPQA